MFQHLNSFLFYFNIFKAKKKKNHNKKSFPSALVVRNQSGQCRRCRFDPWVEKFPGEGNGNPHQKSHLGNAMNREAWWATVHGVAELDTTERASQRYRELYSVLCGDLDGKEIQKRGDTCIHIADLLCCTA